MTRESINRIKVEHKRVSRVPIDPDVTIFQGDLLCWNAASRQAVGASAPSGASFMGMSDTQNPVESPGSPSFTSATKTPRLNVVTEGLVEVIAGADETVFPFDSVVLGADAQTVVKGTSNAIGYIDASTPGLEAAGAGGLAVVEGDPLLIWLKPVAQFVTVGA